jgi:hypothetical protein
VRGDDGSIRQDRLVARELLTGELIGDPRDDLARADELAARVRVFAAGTQDLRRCPVVGLRPLRGGGCAAREHIVDAPACGIEVAGRRVPERQVAQQASAPESSSRARASSRLPANSAIPRRTRAAASASRSPRAAPRSSQRFAIARHRETSALSCASMKAVRSDPSSAAPSPARAAAACARSSSVCVSSKRSFQVAKHVDAQH